MVKIFFYRLCQNCVQNSSECIYCQKSNNQNGIILANRQFPGPSIQVCHNDILVVDVINNVPGYGITIHWRGQANNESPFMDGVPMVTQCAIPSFTTFQYKFRASSSGTHFYHAFSDADRNRGLFGALIVREADKAEPHRKLYEKDLKEHVILLSEQITADGESHILINGRAALNNVNLESFVVTVGERYRFRLAYAAGVSTCPLYIEIENHMLTIISLDGNPTEPYEVPYAMISKGERLDFIVKATKESKVYLLKVKSQCKSEVTGKASITYDGSKIGKMLPYEVQIHLTDRIKSKGFYNQNLFRHIKNLKEISSSLLTPTTDQTFYLGYDYKYHENVAIVGEYY